MPTDAGREASKALLKKGLYLSTPQKQDVCETRLRPTSLGPAPASSSAVSGPALAPRSTVLSAGSHTARPLTGRRASVGAEELGSQLAGSSKAAAIAGVATPGGLGHARVTADSVVQITRQHVQQQAGLISAAQQPRDACIRKQTVLPSIQCADKTVPAASSTGISAGSRAHSAQLESKQQVQQPLQAFVRPPASQQHQPRKLPPLQTGGFVRQAGPRILQQHQAQQQAQQQQAPGQRPSQSSNREEIAVKERTAVWTKLLISMRSNPQEQEFVYLKYAQPQKAPLNPFDLEVCSHSDAVRLPFYFTMSPSGVTTYFADGRPSEFVTLEDFQREFLQHQQLLKLPLFKDFVRWKTVTIWRKAVRQVKTTSCVDHLQRCLYGLHPVLWKALSTVRIACLQVQQQILSSFILGQPLTLEAFLQQHTDLLQHAGSLLQDVVARLLVTTKTACQESLALMERELMAGAAAGKAGMARRNSTGADGAGPPSAAKHPHRDSTGLAAAEPVHLYGDSYALQAARRSEKRRLTAFIKLVDYMLADSVHSMVKAGLKHVLNSFRGRTPLPEGTVSHAPLSAQAPVTPTATDAASGLAATSGASSVVVMQLEVLFDQQHDRLLLQPHAQEFQDALDRWLHGVESMVRDVPQLMQNAQLQQYIEAPIEPQHPNPEGLLPLMLGEDYEYLSERLQTALHKSLTAAEQCSGGFELFVEMVCGNRQFSRAKLQQAVETGELDLQGLRRLLVGYQQQLQDVGNIPPVMSVGLLKLELTAMKAALRPSPQHCLSEMHQLLPVLAAAAYDAFMNKVSSYREQLGQQPNSPEEFVLYMQLLAEVEVQQPSMDKQYDMVIAYYDFLEEFKVSAPEEEVAAARCMNVAYTALKEETMVAEGAKDRQSQAFLLVLEQRTAELVQQVSRLRALEQQDDFLEEATDMSSIVTAITELMAEVQAQQATAEHISNMSVQCGGPTVLVAGLEELAADVEMKHLLWTVQQNWSAATHGWLTTRFFELDVLEMQDQIEQVLRQVHRLERGLAPNDLVSKLRDSVAQWQEILGPVANLRNAQLRERHWSAVADLLGKQVDRTPEADTTITTLLSMQLLHHKEHIAVISNEATQEAALEALLAQVADRWRGVEFEVKRFKEVKDVYILGEVDDVLQVLEDSKITMSMIQASRYVAGIRSEVDRLDKQLHVFSDTLDAWLVVQKAWLALESVFAAPDIQRQVPGEAAAFAQVDRTYKDIMRRTHDRPNALQCGTMPGWLEALQKCCDTLEVVQKGLEDYLETKRVAFPRFYFLSNEELLDILRQAKVPHAVQPHLSKCFDGIYTLEFGVVNSESVGPANDILAMKSIEGERVPFTRTLKARGLVESWLSSVESNMHLTLKALTKKALREHTAARRPGWVLAQPAQLAILVSNIQWCQDVEACLSSNANADAQLQQLRARCVLQLEEMTELIRGPLTDLERKSVVALITTDVHNRDIVSSLMDQGTTDVNDFSWQMQLRFEYDVDTDTVVARQVDARFEYAYEYIGAQPRLVMTPMTDRCYLTLTGALALKLGGAPSGPAGTGKTETVKDLGRTLGVQCVVFNCGESLDYKFMAKFFRGLAQCGAWACFDEFNRINLEVLSVVAQQLLALQAALRTGLERFLFEGKEMTLVPTVGVFITMNPGYAGRTELPDNLKVLFRPMAMMIPDYQLVAEVILFSEGFDQATWLAGKMVQLYKLASEQLSQQDHYDFGMRTLKAVLVTAGAIKRSNPGVAEELVLIQAMRDANLPKLTSEDTVLFEAIISDLFPNTQPMEPDHQLLTTALADACEVIGLQPVPHLIDKAKQLHDTLGVRFGVMLVGPAGSGKSSCHQCLRIAQSSLLQAQHEVQDSNRQQDSNSAAGVLIENAEHNLDAGQQAQIHAHMLNPKSISLSELYGSYSAITHEWTDGLASSLIRQAMADQTQNMHWVVFDGPVDPLWIENMNTVLDDNRMLCLTSGERIKLDEQRLRMLFEVEDLQYASPATVSRCGMVYLPADAVGWRPFVLSWLNRFLAEQYYRTTTPTNTVIVSQEQQTTDTKMTQQDQSTTATDADQIQQQLASEAGARKCEDQNESTLTKHLECPIELFGVRDFLWGLFDKYLDPLLHWVVQDGEAVVPVVEVGQAEAVTMVFETQADALGVAGLFKPALEDRQQLILRHLFTHAAVWGLGGCLSSSSWDSWDQVVREQFDGLVSYPDGAGTVFDYCLKAASDGSSVSFSAWELEVPPFAFQPSQPSYAIMVPTIDTCRYGSMLRRCMAAGQPVMLMGATGVGKTALVKDCLDVLHGTMGRKLEHVVLNCSARTSSRDAQGVIQACMVKRGNKLGPPAGHKLVVFVDDINLPEQQQFGAQPPLEMLRLLLDQHGLYDRKTLAWKEVLDVVLVAACVTPGGGRQEMSKRFTRQMLTLAIPAANETVMQGICTAIVGGFLGAYFSQDVCSKLLLPLVESCVEIYSAASAVLLPTPSRSHYMFNFRDVIKVLQGILSIRPAQCKGDPIGVITRLWLHETQRVFGDRLICQEDRDWIQNAMEQLLVDEFQWKPTPQSDSGEQEASVASTTTAHTGGTMMNNQASRSLFEGGSQLLFGDFYKIGLDRQDRVYEQLPSVNKLVPVMEKYLDEYNAFRGKSASAALAAATSAAAGNRKQQDGSAASAATASGRGGCKMQLVFFEDAVLHITRLARILRSPRGSALLVGVGGTGKQSLARFAALVADCDVFTVNIRRGYNITNFREEIKQLFKIAGVDGRHVMFLLTDSHIVDDAMLGDVNTLLSTGEITGLFTAEEQGILLDQVRPWLSSLANLGQGRKSAWEAFVSRARHHIHVVFATSPVGEAFRVRCRQFPALVNCTTIDWFDPWPADALLGVGIRHLEQLGLDQPPVSQLPDTTTPAQSGSGRLMIHRIAQMCVEVHKSVEASAEKYYQEMKRRCYITPKLYLDLLQQYTVLLTSARTELGDNRRRLLTGISKLTETNTLLDTMQSQLNTLQPLLAEKTAATTALLQQVRSQQEEAEKVAAVVSAEEAEVAAKAAECAALKAAAEAELAAVLPALEAAVSALDALNKADIIEMKTFIHPPALVQLTMEAVCILLQEKTDWDSAKRVLGDANFINRLIEFDKDKISEKLRKELNRIIADPSFTPDQVGKQSKAAMSMCLWVRAMDTYATVYRIVEPKRQALAAAQAALDASNAALAEKQAQLQAIKDKVAKLQEQLAETQKELASLQYQADLCNARLGRADKLTSLLGDELQRWSEAAAELAGRLQLLIGDVFMAAAVVNYLGAFTSSYRIELVAQWYQRCQELDIPITTPKFSLSGILSTPVELLDWTCQGLPSDSVSVENALIATRGYRWPLMVDPQGQANRWIRTMEAKMDLVVLKESDPNLLRQVENAVRLGHPLLIEQVGESSLPAGLEPLLLRQVDKQGGPSVIRLADHDVDYDSNFKLYMTTQLTNPHYLPEAYIQVNLVNFMVTKEGLEEQLLAELVRVERPALEESRESLVISISSDKRQLLDLEAKILQLLRETDGNLLDDEILISTLNSSKATSGVIRSRVREAELTEAQINEARSHYRAPPVTATRLWFVVSELESLNSMYQASLAGFKAMYLHCISSAPAAPSLEGRLQALETYLTSYVHRMVCRGLFDAHRLVFGFMIAAADQKDKGVVTAAEWELLVRGSKAAASASRPAAGKSASDAAATMRCSSTNSSDGGVTVQPDMLSDIVQPGWCSTAVWSELRGLESALPYVFYGLCSAVAADVAATDGVDSWQHLLRPGSTVEDFVGSNGSSSRSDSTTLSGDCMLDRLVLAADIGQDVGASEQQQEQPSNDLQPACKQARRAKLSNFQKLLLLKACREELFVSAVRQYVATQLGPSFVELPATTLMDAYLDSSPYTPITFLLAQGADAVGDLARFAAAQSKAVGKGLQVVSLGQGQGPVAEALVHLAQKSGDWVCLQNCHLAKSWMPQLAQLVEQLQEAARSPDTEQQLHPSFRLWLTTMPAEYFPSTVLQRSVRIALEPPQGLKPTLLRSYAALPEGCLSALKNGEKARYWQRVVFAAALLHGLVQERRRYGALGWNIPYEFSDGDLTCALQNMQNILQDSDQRTVGYDGGDPADVLGPSAWEAMRYIVGQINYGGRVTDANDRRLLTVIMEQHLQSSILGDSSQLACTVAGSLLKAPTGSDITSCILQLQALPHTDDPCILGFSTNASITLHRKEARDFIDSVVLMQPKATTASCITPGISSTAGTRRESWQPGSQQQASAATEGPAAPEAMMLNRIAEMLEQLPGQLQRGHASSLHDPSAAAAGGGVNSLGVMLLHETARYNKLLSVVQGSLLDLQAALQGLLVMSRESEATLQALTNFKIPPSWSAAAYPSNKSLATWLTDLSRRVTFMQEWLTTGQPAAFWLPGFFFPQGFLTAVLQNHARGTGMPIDYLSFQYRVLSSAMGPADISAPPPVGVYVYGLYLEAARWDKAAGCLAETAPGEMFDQLPVVHLIPHNSTAAAYSAGAVTDAVTQRGDLSSSKQGTAAAAGLTASQLSQLPTVAVGAWASTAGVYECPLYKTPSRAGVLSTTGHSTNFLMHVSLAIPATTTPQHWLLQGVALLCSVDDE